MINMINYYLLIINKNKITEVKAVTNVLIRAGSLILIMACGYLMKQIGWVKKEDFSIFSKIVLRFTLPCAIITSFNEVTVHSSMIIFMIIGIAVNLLAAIIGFVLGKSKGRKEQAFHILNLGSYNIGAFTLPYVSGFLGANGVLVTSIFDVGNSIGAAGFNYSIAKSLADEKNKVTLHKVIKNMISSPIFDTYVIMFILRLLDIKLPSGITTFTGIVGQANTFLAMIMIGIAFELHLDKSRVKKVTTIIVTRYILAICSALCIYFLTPFSREVKQVLCIVLFSPIAAMTPGFTEEIEGDVKTSSFSTTISTLISIVIITTMLVIMSL